ncbi:MAG: hypothetical protein SFV15_09090 [Polyangiaceae bacterium]|nr:hypothetical protein [Polyangiaceae bacterium]
MASLQTPKLLALDAEFARASWFNMYVMVWSGEVRSQHLTTLEQEMWALATTYPGVIALSILEQGARPPEPWAREIIKNQQRALASHLVKSVQLVDGQGFWASSVIGVVVSFQNLRETGLRQSVARSVAEAAKEICPFVRGPQGQTANALDVAKIIQGIRTQRNARAA